MFFFSLKIEVFVAPNYVSISITILHRMSIVKNGKLIASKNLHPELPSIGR